MSKFGFRSLLSGLLSCLLVLISLTPIASAAPTAAPTLTDDEAIALLQAYGIVQGDESGNLNLDRPITRAEAAKIFVVAMGSGEYADLLKDSVRYTDARGHWAAGYIETASRLNLVKGRGADQFDPQANITNAEVFTIILRMLEKEPSGPWNAMTIMSVAAQLGITPNVPLEALANVPALRGIAFRGLGRALATVPLTDGSTLLRKNLDSVPPEISLNTLPATVNSETITVSGSVKGAYRVTVNGATATITGNTFSAQVSLAAGPNTITAIAKDYAGNTSSASATVSRGGQVASIKFSGPSKVKIGDSVSIKAQPYDANGNALPPSLLKASLSGKSATYDVASGLFKAGIEEGQTTITVTSGNVSADFSVTLTANDVVASSLRVKPVNSDKAITVNSSATVQVEVLDADGDFMANDDGRTVSLTADKDEVTISPASAKTVGGIATFTIASPIDGSVVLTARSGSLDAGSRTVEIATSTRVVLVADPSSAPADGTTQVRIRAVLQDDAGKSVTNSSNSDIQISLSTNSTNSYLGWSSLTIRRGTSASTEYADMIAGLESETVRVTGTISTNQRYTVVPATVAFRKPDIGSATVLDLVGGYGAVTPGGNPVPLTVRLTDKDGNTITGTDVAFQVKVTTSNDVGTVSGLPAGVSLTLGDTYLVPVVGESGAVIARTSKGSARLNLSYDRSGKVTVQVVAVKASEQTYNDDGIEARANASTSFTMGSRAVTFNGTASGLSVRFDLPASKHTNQSEAVLAANGRATTTVKVYPVDAKDGWVSTASGKVTLNRTSGPGSTRSTGSKADTAEAYIRNGVAEFTIMSASSSISGEDVWTATWSQAGTSPKTFTVRTVGERPDQPVISGIFGESGEPNRILPDDDYMLVDLEAIPGAYGFVKVYRNTSSTPIYTSDILNLADKPSVKIPKSLLPASDRYTVVVNNGFGDSIRSMPWPSDTAEYVVIEKEWKVSITRVRYDAATNKLIVTASGVTRRGQVDPSLLFIGSDDLMFADCVTADGSFTCTLPYPLDFSQYKGTPVLDTATGWFRDTDGKSALRDENLSDNIITPAAYIDYSTVQFVKGSTGKITGTLTLHGRNLTQGRIYLANLLLGGTPLGTGSALAPTGTSTKVTITLPQAITDTIYANGAGVSLEANLGWLKSSYGDQSPAISTVPVFRELSITGIRYLKSTAGSQGKLVIQVNGSEGANLIPDALLFTDRRGTAEFRLSGATVEHIGDAFEITLSSSDTSKLESGKFTNGTSYNGNIYLTSEDVSTGGAAWLTLNGWEGTTLVRYRLSW